MNSHNSHIDTNVGLGIQLTKKASQITKVSPLSPDKEHKILIRNIPLLGKGNPLVERSYEEILFLLFYEKEPDEKELKQFKIKISHSLTKQNKLIKKLLKINTLAKKPLIFLQILILTLAYEKNLSKEEIIAKAFVITANLFNIYFGKPWIDPKPNLSLIENLLYIIGKDYKNSKIVNNFSRIMIAWMDVGLAPSAVAIRVNASSRSDIISALVAGIGNTCGIKHTSARINSMKLLTKLRNQMLKFDISFPIKSPEDKKLATKIVRENLQKLLFNQQLVPGFGHYIFKGLTDEMIDPRIYLVERAINELYPHSQMLQIVNIMREVFRNGSLIRDGQPFKLPPNSDVYWSAFLCDFFNEYGNLETVSAVASLFNILTRMSGLLAHDTEQRTENASMKAWGWILKN